MSEKYDFRKIEKKWQDIWEKEKSFKAAEDAEKPKYYTLEMYPYPSGRIHMGHVRNFSILDVISRYKIMNGYNVLHPIGWDAFGMPAENAAIKEGIHPREWTLGNIAHMKSQLKRLGFSYDWSREINTCLPEYYKWNQWIFLKMFERGLAFRKKSSVNWCPECQTVLANEQVISGKCWRCDAQVEQKHMEQWFLRITKYADELLTGHKQLSKWPQNAVTMQRNWIGKSKGAQLFFKVSGSDISIETFTTRIDTVYGATFLVLSLEHPLCSELIKGSENEGDKRRWIEKQRNRQRLGEEVLDDEKEGIFSGKTAVNPFTNEPIQIWIANYVLMEYGTGAIMAVPAHDERDFQFAEKYSLPVKEVIVPAEGAQHCDTNGVFTEYGKLVNSGNYDGMTSQQAISEMIKYLQNKGLGKEMVLYRLRDWGISRQRYWGTPIPIIYCKKCGITKVPYKDLPVTLPSEVEFKGEEGSPLERSDEFVKTKCPLCNGEARRETDTMDTFFDSSWYYFRYCSPSEENFPFKPEKAKYWLPVDLYVGGVEHAILHLIYARFFCKVLRDFGLTDIDEPFPHYLAQGMVTKDGSAMSKSRGNVVDPDDMVNKYGADTVRLFILFAAPPEKEFAWDDKGIEGCYRFLNRVWIFFQENLEIFEKHETAQIDGHGFSEEKGNVETKMHQTIKKVTGDIGDRYHLNTAISSIMEFFNEVKKAAPQLKSSLSGRKILKQSMEALLKLLSPFAPHISEELWESTGHDSRLVLSSWPGYEPDLIREDIVTIVVQVNGKLRGKFESERNTPEEDVKSHALSLEHVKKYMRNQEPKKIIYIKNKLVNIVI
ncbi:MAG: leucine--tRNA ligase [Candidatus Aminicenantes bacterium]|nr:leucine--tRNA ligase [Candidatus Aminicenantes bacterium]